MDEHNVILEIDTNDEDIAAAIRLLTKFLLAVQVQLPDLGFGGLLLLHHARIALRVVEGIQLSIVKQPSSHGGSETSVLH